MAALKPLAAESLAAAERACQRPQPPITSPNNLLRNYI
jgi:hypothetical protein